MSPRSSSAAASSRSPAQPSNSAAATSARRCGSQTRSHSIGGPECSSVPSPSPGTTVARRRDGDGLRRCVPSIAATARALASAIVAPCRPHRPRQRAHRVGVAAGGRAPVDLDDGRPLVAQGVGEHGEAEP